MGLKQDNIVERFITGIAKVRAGIEKSQRLEVERQAEAEQLEAERQRQIVERREIEYREERERTAELMASMANPINELSEQVYNLEAESDIISNFLREFPRPTLVKRLTR